MRENEQQRPGEGLIEGRNAVTEALRAGTAIDKLYVAKGDTDRTLARIAAEARRAGVVVVEADKRKLDAMSATHSHQGVIAAAAAAAYASLEDILQRAADRGESPLLVVCDEISDPHNLGAIIRTAECAGAHGVIIPHRRGGQDQRRGGELPACGPGAQPARRAQGAEKAGDLDLRRRRRRLHLPLRGGSAPPGGHRHRQRGGRHGPSGPGGLRLSSQHPHGGADLLPQRVCGSGGAAV